MLKEAGNKNYLWVDLSLGNPFFVVQDGMSPILHLDISLLLRRTIALGSSPTEADFFKPSLTHTSLETVAYHHRGEAFKFYHLIGYRNCLKGFRWMQVSPLYSFLQPFRMWKYTWKVPETELSPSCMSPLLQLTVYRNVGDQILTWHW